MNHKIILSNPIHPIRQVPPKGVQPSLRDTQLEPPLGFCARCGGEFWKGATLYQVCCGELVCEECFYDLITMRLYRAPQDMANALGIPIRHPGVS